MLGSRVWPQLAAAGGTKLSLLVRGGRPRLEPLLAKAGGVAGGGGGGAVEVVDGAVGDAECLARTLDGAETVFCALSPPLDDPDFQAKVRSTSAAVLPATSAIHLLLGVPQPQCVPQPPGAGSCKSLRHPRLKLNIPP